MALAAASSHNPGQSHCSKRWKPRSHFHGICAHIHTSDPRTTDTVSAPIPKDPGAVVILHVPHPRTPALLLLWLPACQARCQNRSPQLELTPKGKNRNKNKKSLAVVASKEPNSSSYHCHSQVLRGAGHRRPPAVCTDVNLSWCSCMKIMPPCFSMNQRHCIPSSWHSHSHLQVNVFSHWS